MGYHVTVYDILYYGSDFLPLDNPSLTVVQGDVRDINKIESIMPGVEAVLHLACISNDASFELDENLSTTVNMDAFEPIVLAAKKAGVKRFVFASSSSVYGISEEPDVKEGHPLVPLTLYNKYKGLCEPILFKHTDQNFVGVVYRPATVCGYSKRQRLDVVVNILTNLAYHNREITIFGGEQLRPNIHIDDMVEAYMVMLDADGDYVSGEIFNVGYENQTVRCLAETVRDAVGRDVKLSTVPTDDNRSYHISSEKIRRELGFSATHSVEEAVRDLLTAFDSGSLPNSLTDEKYFNIKRMQSLDLE